MEDYALMALFIRPHISTLISSNHAVFGIFIYCWKWKMLFGRPLVYITKRSWSWDAKSWSWNLVLVLGLKEFQSLGLEIKVLVLKKVLITSLQEGHLACKKLGVGLLVVTIWLELCMSFRAPVVTTTSIILSSNEIQNVDILVQANPGPPGK